jgi:hypothetical protein
MLDPGNGDGNGPSFDLRRETLALQPGQLLLIIDAFRYVGEIQDHGSGDDRSGQRSPADLVGTGDKPETGPQDLPLLCRVACHFSLPGRYRSRY